MHRARLRARQIKFFVFSKKQVDKRLFIGYTKRAWSKTAGSRKVLNGVFAARRGQHGNVYCIVTMFSVYPPVSLRREGTFIS